MDWIYSSPVEHVPGLYEAPVATTNTVTKKWQLQRILLASNLLSRLGFLNLQQGSQPLAKPPQSFREVLGVTGFCLISNKKTKRAKTDLEMITGSIAFRSKSHFICKQTFERPFERAIQKFRVNGAEAR